MRFNTARVRTWVVAACVFACAGSAWAQGAGDVPAGPIAAPPAADAPTSTATLSTRSTLVLVPALVRNKKSGELVWGLKAEDFTLTDNRVPQALRLEENVGDDPLALVVVVEAGGNSWREAESYTALPAMIESVIGGVEHRVAVVGFDSRPELEQDFTANTDEAAGIVQQLIEAQAGDKGGAILDALGFSVDLLKKQPLKYRRAILLISETIDHGSKMKLQDAVRMISDTNTAIYSVSFSTGASAAKEDWEEVRSAPPSPALTLMPEIEMIHAALTAAIDALRKNTPEAVARLTGGEYLRFGNAKGLARSLQAVGNHIPNRYLLSFQPQSPKPGLHVLNLQLKDYDHLAVTSRPSYWAEDGAAPVDPAKSDASGPVPATASPQK